MRQKAYLVAIFLLLLMICALTLAVKDQPKCDIQFLTLSEELMSGQWRVSDPDLWPAFLPVQDRLGAQEAFRISMKNDDNGAIGHTVYRYRNRWLATFHLWFDREVFFPSVGWTWSDLEEAKDLLLHADQRTIRCGITNPGFSLLGNQCTAVLRYGPYISDFDASFGEQGDMSVEEFLQVVTMIDERFRSCGY